MASAALGAALFMAGAPGYGGDHMTGNGHGTADTYDIVNLVPGVGYGARINTRGQAAFEYVSFANRLRVGFFDGEGVRDISPPTSDSASLGDMNEKGEVAEYAALPSNDGFARMPFRWSPAAGWTALPALGTDSTLTEAMNDRGVIVGESYVAGDGYRPVRWSAANDLVTLQTPSGFTDSYVSDINEHGASVGAATDPAGAFHAFLWDTTGAPTDLGTFGATEAVALHNNRRGEVVGWLDLYGPDFQAFLWSPGKGVTRVGLHTLPGALNNAGELVGRIYDPDTSTNHAYVFGCVRGICVN
ncbi:hypothetical protein IA69_27285 [Massilia sp. JS1662]|nr:hypothetical protein IA69_27285 [Massilia sp. JS1662]